MLSSPQLNLSGKDYDIVRTSWKNIEEEYQNKNDARLAKGVDIILKQ